MKYIFDLDGTITSAETLPIIADAFEIDQQLAELTAATVSGKVPWRSSFIKRVDLLKHISVDQINALLSETPLYTGIVDFIKENKSDCVIATGNLDCWVDGLCARIGCHYYSSKATVVDSKIVKISEIIDKAQVVNRLKRAGERTVFVGDSNNDAEAMRSADISIAYGASHQPSRLCLDAADFVVHSEEDLLNLLIKIKKSTL